MCPYDWKFSLFNFSRKDFKVTHWIMRAIKFAKYKENGTSTSKLLLIKYLFKSPMYDWKNIFKLVYEIFQDVLSSVKNNSSRERPLLHVHIAENSPDASPGLKKEEFEEISSVSSLTTYSSGQDDFKQRTNYRNGNCCLFCGFDSIPLFAAHILPFSKFQTEESVFTTCDICAINDKPNRLTLRRNFTHYLV